MKLSKVVLDLLKNRDIREEEIEEFLSDKPKRTYNPSLLKDLDEGVDLILSHVDGDSKICIYGDYDADGITATTIMMSVLSYLIPETQRKERLGYYIPSRLDEGYGLNMEAMETIAKGGYNLIITVDCGSLSYDEVEYGKTLGIDILVTDHHTVTDKRANCLLINPNRPDDTYPFKGLAGCGVAFKVAQRIQKKADLPKRVLSEVLDLVALGTIGDIMPLVDENRTLVKFGLKALNCSRREGLKRLIAGAKLDETKISSTDVAFVIVPHLNASGRMNDATLAVKLLEATLKDTGEEGINEMVDKLLEYNKERKRRQEETYRKCMEKLGEEREIDDFILINAEDAHEGITGIVAGKLKETFYRPTVLVTPTGDGMLKGTGRSIDGLNLYELLKENEALFKKFGGHKAACGFTMEEGNFQELKENLLRQIEQRKKEIPRLLEKVYEVDMDIELEEVTISLVEELEQLEPFGNKNPRPVFKIPRVSISDVRYMGNENQHTRFTLFDERRKGIPCVLFSKAKEYEPYFVGNRLVNVIGTLETQIWQGVKRLQVRVDKIEFD